METTNTKNNKHIDKKVVAEIKAAEEHGRTSGLENQPPSLAIVPCDRENQIQRAFDGFAREYKEKFEKELQHVGQQWLEIDQINKRISELSIKDYLDQARQNYLEVETTFTSEHKERVKGRNYNKRRFSVYRDKGLKVSSSAHGSYALVYAFLLLFLLIESFANSYFLGMGNELGMLGGVIEALFIALLSICFSYTAGIGVRAITGRGLLRRTAGFFGGCLFFMSIVAYHTLIGWYRGCLVYLNPETAKADAMINFMQHGMALPDLHCYGLAVVGIFFGGTAFVAGFQCRDARLAAEYARIAKEYEITDTQLKSKEEEYLASLNEVCCSRCEEVDSCLNLARDAESQTKLLELECSRVINHFTMKINDIQDSCAYAIELFRRSNKAVRDTPAPTYFNNKPSPLSEEVKRLDTTVAEEIEQSIINIGHRLNKLEELSDEIKNKIRAEYQTNLQAAPKLFDDLRKEKCDYYEEKNKSYFNTKNIKQIIKPIDSPC